MPSNRSIEIVPEPVLVGMLANSKLTVGLLKSEPSLLAALIKFCKLSEVTPSTVNVGPIVVKLVLVVMSLSPVASGS